MIGPSHNQAKLRMGVPIHAEDTCAAVFPLNKKFWWPPNIFGLSRIG